MYFIFCLQDVATVLADVFDDRKFVPTDIAAALLLLYARQSDQAEGIVMPGSAADLDRAPPPSRPRYLAPEVKPFDHPGEKMQDFSLEFRANNYIFF